LAYRTLGLLKRARVSLSALLLARGWKDSLPIVLHADHGPAVLFRLSHERVGERADLRLRGCCEGRAGAVPGQAPPKATSTPRSSTPTRPEAVFGPCPAPRVGSVGSRAYRPSLLLFGAMSRRMFFRTPPRSSNPLSQPTS